jgi:TonB-linked SusC/RagA family outer membrane protein
MRKITILLAFLFFVGANIANAQTRTISGKVTGSGDGAGIPGVTVQVEGTTIGTVTDIDGNYTLDVSPDAKSLVYKFVGMKTVVVAIGDQKTIYVAMDTDAVIMGEVVITALGITREKKSLGYSVQEIGGAELHESGQTDAISGLSGKVAGLQITSSSGTPGASSRILLRGASTFTGENQPLIVVDGVPIDNTTTTTTAGDYPYNMGLTGVNNGNRGLDINPDDIESVTVLKGPAAAALYGVRAGNGAIVYTTKKGSSTEGNTIKLTASYQFQLNSVNKLPDLQTTYAQGSGGEYIPFEDNGGTSYSWGPKIGDGNDLKSYDNVDEFFENGIGNTWNVSAIGGNDKSTFRASIGNTAQSGMIPNSKFGRTNVRLSGSSQIFEKLHIGGSINYSNTTSTMVQNGSNISGTMLSLLRTPPSFNLKGEGDNGYMNADGTQRQYFWLYDNTYWSAYKNPFTSEVNRMMGNLNITYNAFEWFDITYRLGADVYSDSRQQLFAVGSMEPPSPTGQIELNTLNSKVLYSDLLLTFKKKITETIFGSLILGNNLYQRNFDDLYSRGRNLAQADFYNLSNASELYTSNISETERSAALFFDLVLDYKSIVYLEVTGRNEWASTFGPAKDNFFYPSATLSLVFTELIPENNILTFGKVRGGYAEVGITPEPYMTRTYFTNPIFTDGYTNGLSFPYLDQNGSGYSSTLGNGGLKPEKVAGIEFGIDLRFLEGRINLDVAYYNQKSSDLLLYRPVAQSSGFADYFSNSGEMVNKGIEIVLNGSIIKTKDFVWDLTVNFAKNNNEVLKLVDGVDELSIEEAFNSIGSFAIVGDAYGAFYGTKWMRSDNGEMLIDDDGYPIEDSERGYVGNPFPDWQMGIRNQFSYKGISLTALLDIRQGGDLWGGTVARINRQGVSEASAEHRGEDLIVPGVNENTGEANTVAISNRDYYTYYKGDFGATEEAVFDGSWVRLKEISLSYHLKLSKYNNVVKYADFTLSGTNLWLSTDYPGVDPETSLTGAGSNIGGFDYFNNPGSKTFIFGIKLGF